ncbi:iron ABC transporter [Ureibacillus massiliensis 4400831 = CIP 108448 = CCUG 49529]|uniref:Iron ABC transporter n=1 Tax=Ureibacillus massiliensis 4400831 = CIP 108448 = CCUG 49529 TaxID=1211035 RepID=A0A0A3J967_9BACL|nr:iron chelate uptake ABC transporter family permease subunit [Ureibacillus massiliensis]KGR91718.1 iron ABC transporter [Ureibacillus massiliensis 4400831 = CIP 108448 = CCUG 49529]
MRNPSSESNFIKVGIQKRKRRWIFVTSLLIVFAVALCWAMLLLGNTIYPVNVVIRSLMGEEISGANFAINTIRFPRMITGLFSGFAFGVAGYIFQTMLRNPLANPNILGITSGSSAAAVFCIVILHSSNAVVSIAAIIGGLITVIIMYLLSRGRSFSIGRLIIIGIGMQAMLDAVISFLILKSSEQDIAGALRWLSGSLNGSSMSEAIPLIIIVIVLTPVMLMLGKELSMLELGDQMATSLGVATDKMRITLIISSVVMIAIATATTGPIAFVSFLAGPIANRLVGISSSNILPAGLIGAILVLFADLIGQFAFEYRFPVGVITGILGAPYLIYLLIRMNQKGEL